MDEQLSDAEMLARLEVGLRWMPKLRREIFLAIRLDDMSYPEIAERTGITVGEVERQFAKGLLQLHDALHGRLPVPLWRRLLRWIIGSSRR